VVVHLLQVSLIDDIGNFFLGVTRIESDIETLITDLEALYENIRAEVRKIKQFKSAPHWKNRVINAPAAIDQTRDLITDINDEVQGAFKSLVSNLRALKSGFQPPSPEGKGGGVLKILGILDKIRSFVTEIDQGVKALSGFVDALRRIQDELETFDSIFLQQGNTRKVERLTTGEKVTIRVGSLHS
jgi:hypothetical protein